MNISGIDLKLADLIQNLSDGNKQNTLKAGSEVKDNSFSDVFKGVTTNSEKNPLDSTSEQLDNTVRTAFSTDTNVSQAINLSQRNKLLADFGNKSEIKTTQDAEDSELAAMIQKLLGSIKEMQSNESTEVMGVKQTSDKDSKSEILDQINQILKLVKMSSVKEIGTGSDESTNSSLQELLPMLMLMIAKASTSTSTSTAQTNSDKSSLDKASGEQLKDMLTSVLKSINQKNTEGTTQEKSSLITDGNISELVKLISKQLSISDVGDTGSKSDKQQGTKVTEKLLLKAIKELSEKVSITATDGDEKEATKVDMGTLLNALQELNNKLVSDKTKHENSILDTENTSNTENVQQTSKSKTVVDENPAKDIEKSLSTIIETVTQNLKLKDGEVTDTGLTKAFKEIVDDIKLSKDTLAVNVLNSIKTDISENASTKEVVATNTSTKTNVSGEQNFKNQLVEILVVLSSPGNAKDGENQKSSNIKKFTELLNAKTEELVAGVKTTTSKEDSKTQADSQSYSKEDKILRDVAKLTSNSDDTKVDKVNNFIEQLTNKTEVKTPIVEDKPVINRATFTQDIIKAVKYMSSNDLKELSVKINPKELGEITIKLTMDQGTMKASISANTKDTYNLISNNLNDLTSQLSNSDIKIHSLDVNVYQEDTTFFNESNSQGQEQSKQGKNKNRNLDGVQGINSITDSETVDDNNISALV